MFYKIKQKSGKEKQHPHGGDKVAAANDEEIEKIDMMPKKTVIEKIMENLAKTRVGQTIIVKMDRVLNVVEDTARWSLPQENYHLKLERPLPWIPFLTLIFCLRVLRLWLSVAAHIAGAQPVTPYSVVYYMQSKRRYLRAIRVQGLKTMANREMEATIMFGSNRKVTFMERMGKLISRVICKPAQYNAVPAHRVFVQDGKLIVNPSERSAKRPRDDSFDPNLTVSEMLETYANEDSDNDSDYIPKANEDDDFSTSSANLSDEESKQNIKIHSSTFENDESKKNDEVKNSPKPKVQEEQAQTETQTANEPTQTPKETANINSATEESSKTTETPAATTEVEPAETSRNAAESIQNYLTPAHMQKDKQKSTPGHETAASLKPTNSGSPQDFQSMFQPAPIVKDASHTDFYFSSTPDVQRS